MVSACAKLSDLLCVCDSVDHPDLRPLPHDDQSEDDGHEAGQTRKEEEAGNPDFRRTRVFPREPWSVRA